MKKKLQTKMKKNILYSFTSLVSLFHAFGKKKVLFFLLEKKVCGSLPPPNFEDNEELKKKSLKKNHFVTKKIKLRRGKECKQNATFLVLTPFCCFNNNCCFNNKGWEKI